MDFRLSICCPGDYGDLKAERNYTLEEIFEELDKLSCENEKLKDMLSDMEDDIRDNYVRRNHYDS